MTQLVKDVMVAGPAAVRPDASLAEVARLMRDQHVGDVLVAQGDALLGLVTDRDIIVADGVDPDAVSVGSMCGSDPVSVHPDDTAQDAYLLMRAHDVRRLPVMDDGRPVGIVGLGDLLAQRGEGSAPGGIGHVGEHGATGGTGDTGDVGPER
jgi:CBS domain-containing protein